LRSTGKFLIAAIINESWTSGTVNCAVDLFLASGKCPPAMANYLSTAISVALTSYIYLQTGPISTAARFIGSYAGSWLGTKAFWGAKKCVTFFRTIAREASSIYWSDVIPQHHKTG